MSDTPADQRPEAWSDGATGYAEAFADYTATYVDEVLDLLGVHEGTAVLDVATGTGAAALLAARRGATVTAIDFAPGMVEVATSRLADAGAGAATAVMDGQDLDLPDAAFDAALSMFGLMFFPDAPRGVAEMARVVRPGGRIATTTWDLDAFPLRRLVGDALSRVLPDAGQLSDRPPTWAAHGSVEGLHRLLDVDGVLDVEVRSVERRWHFADPARFFLDMPGWSPPVQDLFDALPAPAVERAAVAFVDVVGEQGGGPGAPGIPMAALIGVGTVAGTG